MSLIRNVAETLSTVNRIDRELEVLEEMGGIVRSHDWVDERQNELSRLAPVVDEFQAAHPEETEINQELLGSLSHVDKSIEVWREMADRGSAFSHGMGRSMDRVAESLGKALVALTPEDQAEQVPTFPCMT